MQSNPYLSVKGRGVVLSTMWLHLYLYILGTKSLKLEHLYIFACMLVTMNVCNVYSQD